MFSQMCLCCCLIVAFSAQVFDSFMCCPLVSSQSSLLRKLFKTLPTRIFDFFVYSPLMFSQICLCCCLIVTFSARVLDSFVWCPLVSSQSSIWEYCLPHCPQGYYTPSCIPLWCSARLLFVVAFSEKIFDSFMYCPLVFIKTSLLRKFIAAMPSGTFYTFIEHNPRFVAVNLLMKKWHMKENWN